MTRLIGEPEVTDFKSFAEGKSRFMDKREISQNLPILFTKVKKRVAGLVTSHYTNPDDLCLLNNKKMLEESGVFETEESGIHPNRGRSETKASLMAKKLRSGSPIPVEAKPKPMQKIATIIEKRRQAKSTPVAKAVSVKSDSSMDDLLESKKLSLIDRAKVLRKYGLNYKEWLLKRRGYDVVDSKQTYDTGVTPIQGRYLKLASQTFWEDLTRRHEKFKNYINKVNAKFKFDKQPPKSQLEKFFASLTKPEDPIDDYIKKNFKPDFSLPDPTASTRKIKRRKLPHAVKLKKLSQKANAPMEWDLGSSKLSRSYNISVDDSLRDTYGVEITQDAFQRSDTVLY